MGGRLLLKGDEERVPATKNERVPVMLHLERKGGGAFGYEWGRGKDLRLRQKGENSEGRKVKTLQEV